MPKLKRWMYFLQKRVLTQSYKKLFEQIDGVELFVEPAFGTSNYWLQTIILDSEQHSRDDVLDLLNKDGAMARPIWTPMNELTPYMHCPKGDLTVTNELNKRVINIPSTPLERGNQS